MKRFLMLLACGVIALSVSVASASTEGGDRILGVYKAVKDGAVSKVRISKIGDNAYKAQLFWLEKDKNPDGSLRTDLKNPDPAKRKTPANQIVLIQSVSYDSKEGVWKDGNIYDPTSGKVYKTVVDFTDEKTLRVRGYLGPFSKSLYWHKIEE
mgnify:CR=1 FL=1|jgi:uncharacterized protein (DUF2147 family)